MAIWPKVIPAQPSAGKSFYIGDNSTYQISRTQNGPFLYGSTLYVCGYVYDNGDGKYYVAVQSSTDWGTTWTLHDHANAQEVGSGFAVYYTRMVRWIQIGAKLWWLVNDPADYEQWIMGTFDCDTDSYDAFVSTGTSIENGIDIPEDRTCELSPGPGNGIYLIGEEEVEIEGESPLYLRTWIKRYDIGSDTWGEIEYLDGEQLTKKDTVAIGMRFDQSASPEGDLHIVFATQTHSNRGGSPDYYGVEIYYVSHDGTSSPGGLGTPTLLYTSGTPGVGNHYPLDANWWSLTLWDTDLYLVRDRYVSTGVYDVYVDTIDLVGLTLDSELVFNDWSEYYSAGYALAVDDGTDTLHLIFSYSKTTSPATPTYRTIGHYARIDNTWEEEADRYTYDTSSEFSGGIKINGTRNVGSGSRPPWGFIYFLDGLTVLDFLGCVCPAAASPSPGSESTGAVYVAY